MSLRSGGAKGSTHTGAVPIDCAPSFMLNGETVLLDGVDPHESLLEIVRRNGVTGPK